MDFSLPTDIEDVRRRVRDFVETRLIPLEADRANYDEHDNIRPDVLKRMRSEAKQAGLWALQMPKSRTRLRTSSMSVGSEKSIARLLEQIPIRRDRRIG